VEITFPGNKKVKGKPGESLKALAAKAKYNCPYGCEEVRGRALVRTCC
jgi:hypothetical protein